MIPLSIFRKTVYEKNRSPLILSLVAISLISLACLVPVPNWDIFSNLDRIFCTNLTGKQWVEDEDGGRCASLSNDEDGQASSDVRVLEEEVPLQGSQEPTYQEPEDCNAYGKVSLITIGPEEKETSFETSCEYILEFTNDSEQPVWIFLHEHNRFMNNEEERKWDNYLNLSPGESNQIKSDFTLRKSDQAVSAHITDKVALIYATEGCINTFKNNSDIKELIAAMTPVLCEP
jgi:hypothetical protein